jgi:hypothetical protein
VRATTGLHGCSLTVDQPESLSLARLSLLGWTGINPDTGADLVIQAQDSTGRDLSIPHVRFAALDDIDLRMSVKAESLVIDSRSGLFTQVKDTVIEVSGDAEIRSRATRIDQPGNRFEGELRLGGGSAQVDIADSLNLVLQTSGDTLIKSGSHIRLRGSVMTAGADLSLQSNGAITQTSALTVAGVTSISAGSGAVTLAQADNDFQGTVSITTTGAVSLRDKDDLTVSLSGASEVSAVTGARLGLSATGALKLASLQVGGDLTLGSTGAITQTGAVTAGGATNISSGDGSVTLTRADNDFRGELSITTKASAFLGAGGGLKLASLQVGGDLALDAVGDIGIQQVRSDRGAIRITSGGAIYDSTSGEPQSRVNVSTPGSLTLSAQSGIGAFGSASLRVSAGSVEASNAGRGDVVIAGMQGLRGGTNGFVNKAPDGWVALLTDQGRLEPGRLDVAGGRSVMMTGKTSITRKEVEGFKSLVAGERAPSAVPSSPVADMGATQLSATSSSVLSAGLAAVTQGLLGGSGVIPISQVISRGSSAPVSVSGKLIDAVSGAASTEKAVSSVLVSVSQTPTASQAMQADTGVSSASTSRAAAAVPAADSVPAPVEAPAQVPEAPARDQGVPNTQPGGASSAPESSPAPADAPASERGTQGSDPRSEAYEPEPVLGLRSRLSAALNGLTGRLLRLIERSGDVDDKRSDQLSMTAELRDPPVDETSAPPPDPSRSAGLPPSGSGVGDGKA